MHALGEVEARYDAFHEVRQKALRFSTDAGDIGIDVTVFNGQVFDGDFLTAGKTHSSLGRLAVAVIGDGDRRALVFGRDVSLFFSDTFHQQGDAARRAQGADRFISDIGFAKRFFSQVFDLAEDTRHIMSRDFFGTDFK